MLLSNPLWLLLLIPWAGLVIFALRNYRPRIYVPFLDLWPREQPERNERRGWRPPSLPVILALLAVLLAIFALAELRVGSAKPAITEMTVVIDRGVTMLPASRLSSAVDDLLRAAEPLLAPDSRIHVLDAAGEEQLAGPSSFRSILSRPATAQDTHARLAAMLKGRRAVVISDLPELPDSAIPVRPTVQTSNVGIVRASANRGRCMLTLRNDSDLRSVSLRLAAANGGNGTTELSLPPRGEERVYTVDAPAGVLAKVELLTSDDLADDNACWILPDQAAAKVTVSATAPEFARQFARSYQEARATPTGAVGIITPGETVDSPALILSLGNTPATIDPQQPVANHPILRHVKLPQRVLAGPPPTSEGSEGPDGWTVLLQSGQSPLLAVRERQVWLGFISASPEPINRDYLILLTNIVDYLARTPHRTSEPTVLSPDWTRIEPAEPTDTPGLRAGVYRRDDELIAINVPAPELRNFAGNDDLASQIAALAETQGQAALASHLWLAAAALLASAVGLARLPQIQNRKSKLQNPR